LRLLLDTHALIWWAEGNARLGERARLEVAAPGNEIYVSAISAMEIATKFRLGKLPDVRRLAEHFEAEVEAEGFAPLALSLSHARLAGSLPIAHKDPFDRMLIAQALSEGMSLVSNEEVFDEFGVSRIW